MSFLARYRARIAAEIEAGGGRHDEPEIYGGEPGDPGLCGPDSLSWEIHGDLASLVVGGTAAILMEVVHPSVMAGVFTHSSYRTEPLRRARNTLGYVLRTTFGSTRGATRVIEGVKRVHARVSGTRLDGVAYQALEPSLIGWVHTCIPWAVMEAFDRTCRPLSVEEKSRYLAEQAVIGRMGGADYVPESVAALEEYVARMRPHLRMTEHTHSFMEFLSGREMEPPVSRRVRFDRWVGIRASMTLMPEWARRLTGTWQPALVQRLWLEPSDRLKARLVRWAYPELPCKRMAQERVNGGTPARDSGTLRTWQTQSGISPATTPSTTSIPAS